MLHPHPHPHPHDGNASVGQVSMAVFLDLTRLGGTPPFSPLQADRAVMEHRAVIRSGSKGLGSTNSGLVPKESSGLYPCVIVNTPTLKGGRLDLDTPKTHS